MPTTRRSKAGNRAQTTKKDDLQPQIQLNPIWCLINYVIFPLLLMLVTPYSVMLIWFVCQHTQGSFADFVHYLNHNNSDVITGLLSVCHKSNLVTSFSTSVVLGFAAWGLLTMVIVPGKTFYGPVTPKGNIPVYRDNGFYCFILTLAALAVTSYCYDVTVIYDCFDEIVGTLCLFSIVFCLLLYLKGRFWPSSTDTGSSGYFIFDYYWGLELHPRFFNIDVKVFTNCRFGMTAWGLLVLVFHLKSYQLHGFVDSMFVCTFLQMAYISKFFWWEAGYMCTIDIMVDRAGYYICWGCLVFIPAFFTSTSQYLVTHPVQLGTPLAASIIVTGLFSLALNYMADWQKQKARRTNGNCTIWGEKAEFIRANYYLDTGEKKSSILLLSGFWGLARHFHYFPELILALSWSLPCLFDHVLPYLHVVFLAVLLVHRSYRDDDKCGKKYGKDWEQYKKRVPYKIIPGVF